MKLNPNQIAPSQDFLKPHTVAFIFNCITKGNLEDLPPDPIVRQDKEGQFIAIDGHNLIAVRAFLGEDVTVHIARNRYDGLPDITKENKTRNQELLEKYEQVVLERGRVEKLGIKTFQDLITQYPNLFNSDKVK